MLLAGTPHASTASNHKAELALISLGPNISLLRTVEHHGNGLQDKPLVLIEGFELISSPEPYTFGDIEEGVSYMAGFVASPTTTSFSPELKAFWLPLLDPNKVHHIFRPAHTELNEVIPNDVDIVTAISIFYTIARSGSEIRGNLHAAYSVKLGCFIAVQTVPESPVTILTDAWPLSEYTLGRQYKGVSIDREVKVGCTKSYVNEEELLEEYEYLGYSCSCEVLEFQHPR